MQTNTEQQSLSLSAPLVDYERMRQAQDAIAARKEREAFSRSDEDSIDALIEQEQRQVRERLYKDKQGLQRLYAQALEFVGLGSRFQGKRALQSLRTMVARFDSVVTYVEDRKVSYAKEQRALYESSSQDRRAFAEYKTLISEKRKLQSQMESELSSLQEDTVTGESNSVRELGLRCNLLDLENDLSMLHNENNELACRLRVADTAIQTYDQARKSFTHMHGELIVQRANVRAHVQKAEMDYSLGTASGVASVRMLYLQAAKAVKQSQRLLGEVDQDAFRTLPPEARIPAPRYLLPGAADSARLEPWEVYDREKRELRR